MNIPASHDFHVPRVRFDVRAADTLAQEVALLGSRRALLLCTAGQRPLAESLGRTIGDVAAGIHDQALMHVPEPTVQAARSAAQALDADLLIAIGGGSTIGLAKAIALSTGLPIIAVPTTYAGSEMTSIFGITAGEEKRTGRDPRVLPRSVIYDCGLSLGLPLPLSLASGLNAIAHAAEGLYARNRTPVTDTFAVQGIRSLAQGLRALRADAADPAARKACLYGSWLCGMVLGHVEMALHHKLCHTLGGSFALPHAQTHAALLPYTIAYNADADPAASARLAHALERPQDPVGSSLYELTRELDARISLRMLGMAEAALPRAAEIALRNPYWNPRPVDAQGLNALLRDAYEGRPPAAG